MTYTFMDSLQLTVAAMLIVFLILTGLMVIMQLTAKITQSFAKAPVPDTAGEKRAEKGTASELKADEELAQAALLAALAEASEDEPDKHYEVMEVKRIA